MLHWLLFFLLQLTLFFVLATAGRSCAIAIMEKFNVKLDFWIDSICLAAVISVAFFSLLGIVVWLLPHELRQIFCIISLISTLGASTYILWRNPNAILLPKVEKKEKVYFWGAILLSGIVLFIALLPVKLPQHLIDGPYVAKHDYLGVRVQYISGNLPADNSIPHVVSEYILRNISFKLERPIMPGQEVTNRPILAALVITPIRAAFFPPPILENRLPKFEYVGTKWPDFSTLMEDDTGYKFSLSIGIFLNSLLLLSAGAFFVRLPLSTYRNALFTAVLFITSPYFIFQTLFTWPKSLAAFFILFSLICFFYIRMPKLAGFSMGLGYLSHPYTIAFFIAFVILIPFLQKEPSSHINHSVASKEAGLLKSLAFKIRCHFLATNRHFLISIVFFLATITPWFIWSKFILDLPSDLVAQNFILPGQRLIDFIWVRPVNFLFTILPNHLLTFPFSANSVLLGSTVNAAGAIGSAFAVFALLYLFNNLKKHSSLLLLFFASVLLILIFSNQAVPALHGLQGPITILLLISILQAAQLLTQRLLVLIVVSQAGINLALLGYYLKSLI